MVRRAEGSRGPEGDAYLYGGDTKYCGTEREVCWPRPGLERKSQGRGFHAWEARMERAGRDVPRTS
jgi:hypothetical protein